METKNKDIISEALGKIISQIFKEEEIRLEGDLATKEIETILVDLGYKVSRDVCPVLLRNRLKISLK